MNLVFKRDEEFEFSVPDDSDLTEVNFIANRFGWRLEAVNDEQVYAFCESCGKPIFCNTPFKDYVSDDEGVYTCKPCYDEEEDE